MLENIRKYTGLMFVVLILLFVGLVFLQSSGSQRGYGSGPVVLQVDGRGYTQQEFERLAVTPLRLLQDLSTQSYQARFAVSPYLYQLAIPPDALSANDVDPRLFLANRLLLQQSARELGIHPSVPEIEQYLRESIFVNQDNTFNATAYDKYVGGALRRLGMSVRDMNNTVREIITLARLTDIVGSGLEASHSAVREDLADNKQQITYKLVTFPASKYEVDETPTDEEVKTYWEENRGRYLSDAQRRISYIIATPDFDALLAEKKTQQAETETEEAAKTEDEGTDETDDQADEGTDETTDEPATTSEEIVEIVTLNNEERDNAIKMEGERIDEFWNALNTADKMDFEGAAANAKFEIKTTELFTKASCPPEFRIATQGIQRRRAVDLIFDDDIGITPMDTISDVYKLGADQWLLYRLDEIVEAKELDFKAAKEEARLDLVQERSREMMTVKSEEARNAILEAMAGGKSFDEAAKEQELEVVSRNAVQRDTRPPGEPTPNDLFNLASKVNPGETSEVLNQIDDARGVFRSLFVYVEKREIIEGQTTEANLDQRFRSMGSAFRQIAIQNWFAQKYQEAGVVIP